MVETIPGRARCDLRPQSKVPLDGIVGRTLDYLRDHPHGATVQELTDVLGAPASTLRKALAIIATVMSKVSPLCREKSSIASRLLLNRSPKGTVIAARLEFEKSPKVSYVANHINPALDPQSKPCYVLRADDVAEVQRAWKLYKATCKAFHGKEAARIAPVRERFPCLFSENATKTGILPTMALFTIAKAIGEYAALGRLPGSIETPGASITFEGGS